ncbi:EAL domain-containing protein [Enterobacter kobei]|nr:EAL domain-containing protein [Enterobacter kobei]
MSIFTVTKRDLSQALYTGRIVPAYQPIIQVPNGIPVGIEILARWFLSDGSSVPPDIFIPLINRSRLEVALSRSLLLQAAPIMRALSFPTDHPLILGINASPECLASPEFACVCAEFLATCNGTRIRLAVEITEHEPLTSGLLPALCWLQHLGIKIVLDDFGTGYATADVLSWLQPDVVKLDHSLTKLAGKNDPDGILTKTIEMLDRYRVDILAEGVETLTEYRWLAERNINLFQGFLFGRPMLAEPLIQNLRDGIYITTIN